MFAANTSLNDCIRFAPTCARQTSLEVLLQLFQSGSPIAIAIDRQQYPVGAIRSHRLLDYLAQNLLLAPVGSRDFDRSIFLASSVANLVEPVEVLNTASIILESVEIAENFAKKELKIYAVVDDRQKFIGILDDRCTFDSVKMLDVSSSLTDRALEVSFNQSSSFLQQWKKNIGQKYQSTENITNFWSSIGNKNTEEVFQELLLWLGHELKSPLTAIVGLSSLLKEAKPEQIENKYSHYADLIHRSGRRMMEIVNDMFGIIDPRANIRATPAESSRSRAKSSKIKRALDRSWQILRLCPQENEFASNDFDIALDVFLSSLQHRILEADSLEQAEILARVWKIDAIVLNGSNLSDPVAYLRSFSKSDYLCKIPLVTLDSKTTEAATSIPTLVVFPYLLPLEEQYLNDVLNAIEIAVG
jgi:signal transduction histidine kinase